MREELNAVAGLVRSVRRLLGTRYYAESILFTCVTLSPTKFWARGVNKMQMTDVQQSVAHIAAVDAEGNPATLDSVPAWVSSDPSIVIVAAAPDGMSAVVSSPTPGPLGSAVVTVTAKIGGIDVSATLAVDIIASTATAINIATDAPTP